MVGTLSTQVKHTPTAQQTKDHVDLKLLLATVRQLLAAPKPRLLPRTARRLLVGSQKLLSIVLPASQKLQPTALPTKVLSRFLAATRTLLLLLTEPRSADRRPQLPVVLVVVVGSQPEPTSIPPRLGLVLMMSLSTCRRRCRDFR
jgi:hypothetical protein